MSDDSSLRAVIFDLDGTLADTLQTIADVANRGLRELGLPEHPTQAYRRFVGDGIVELCRRILGDGQQHRQDELLARVRALYAQHRSDGALLYPGIRELLDQLRDSGARLGVLSNKPDALTHATLADLSISEHFGAVLGQREDLPRKPDPAGARWVCRRLEVEPSEVSYVGDTSTDMHTATAAGFVSVGVSWGFRPVEELRACGAAHLVDEAGQILRLYLEGAASP